MLEQIQSYFEQNKITKFRFTQLENAVFNQFATSFDEITTFPKDLREKLKSEFSLISLTLSETRESEDSTKFVFKTNDGNYIESVLMKHHDGRRTVCVSSQIFCAMGCIFCATGANKYKRNLTADEIVEQVLFVAKHLKPFDERVSNVVFMGMGEPFLNYKNVIESIKIFNNKKYFNIGARHITVSTAGIVPKIREFTELGLQLRLAVSLHAPTDELRSYLMPINQKYSIKELLEATDDFTKKTNKKVSFEYVLITNVNDRKEDAEKLAKLLKPRLCHLNLLVFNPHEFSTFKKPSKESVLAFKKIMDKEGIECSIRKSLGDDISGACGQLSGKKCR